jgi:hypothetical protein
MKQQTLFKCEDCGCTKHHSMFIDRFYTRRCKDCELIRKRAYSRLYHRQYNDAHPKKRVVNTSKPKAPRADRVRAGRAVQAAIVSGKLVRPKCCSRCGSGGKIHGHHSDYRKPLLVVWLCTKCHGQAHRVINDRRLMQRASRAGCQHVVAQAKKFASSRKLGTDIQEELDPIAKRAAAARWGKRKVKP